tara:strand:- start:913 stop:1866 length:954 start_codon:yes stop_codon:yes gene_type:complete
MNENREFTAILLTVGLLLTTVTVDAQIHIPPTPAVDGEGFFIHDYVGIVEPESNPVTQITKFQNIAFNDHSTPIIVVIIPRMASYGYESTTIEPFAREWFNQWEIGTSETDGHNRGILLLVSMGDRKARIELGKDWGRRFDYHCQDIMDYIIIPHFKNGDFVGGITAGVEHLGKMAETGPLGEAIAIPAPKGDFSFIKLSKNSTFQMILRSILFVVGILVTIICAIKLRGDIRKFSLLGGITMIVLAVFPMGIIAIFVFILAWLSPRLGNGNYDGGDYFYSSGSSYSSGGFSSSSSGFSGGGFGGGSSGGGGATGSW